MTEPKRFAFNRRHGIAKSPSAQTGVLAMRGSRQNAMGDRCHRRHHRSRGFSLIEVLCAVIILSIALVAGFQILDRQAQIGAGLEQRVFAHWVAENALAELRAGLIPAASQRMGATDWQLRLRQGPGPEGLIRYEVTVLGPVQRRAVLYLQPAPP